MCPVIDHGQQPTKMRTKSCIKRATCIMYKEGHDGGSRPHFASVGYYEIPLRSTKYLQIPVVIFKNKIPTASGI